MTARALITGRVFRKPERRISNAGNAYVSATIRVGNGDDAQWWKVLTFSETAAEELLTLGDGDGVSATGEFKAEAYEKNGSTRISYTLFADGVISAKRAKRERDKERRAEPKAGPIDPVSAQAPLNDRVPF